MKEPLSAPHFYIFMSTKKKKKEKKKEQRKKNIYVKGRLKTRKGGIRKRRANRKKA